MLPKGALRSAAPVRSSAHLSDGYHYTQRSPFCQALFFSFFLEFFPSKMPSIFLVFRKFSNFQEQILNFLRAKLIVCVTELAANVDGLPFCGNLFRCKALKLWQRFPQRDFRLISIL